MPRNFLLLLILPLAAAVLSAQSVSSSTIQATGTAIVNVSPDQAQLTVTVSADGTTAQQAGQLDATQTAAVTQAIQQVLGSAGNIQTVGYSVYPRYNNAINQASVIVGYTASNTIQVTMNDLTLVGRLIDTANGAGATNVGGLSFSLKDSDPTRLQALGQAAKQAQAHAGAIASGLGAKVGSVVSAQEQAYVSPSPVYALSGAGAATTTPVQTGTVSVTATVTITVQLL
jgi:uncharacterized protein YggE